MEIGSGVGSVGGSVKKDVSRVSDLRKEGDLTYKISDVARAHYEKYCRPNVEWGGTFHTMCMERKNMSTDDKLTLMRLMQGGRDLDPDERIRDMVHEDFSIRQREWEIDEKVKIVDPKNICYQREDPPYKISDVARAHYEKYWRPADEYTRDMCAMVSEKQAMSDEDDKSVQRLVQGGKYLDPDERIWDMVHEDFAERVRKRRERAAKRELKEIKNYKKECEAKGWRKVRIEKAGGRYCIEVWDKNYKSLENIDEKRGIIERIYEWVFGVLIWLAPEGKKDDIGNFKIWLHGKYYGIFWPKETYEANFMDCKTNEEGRAEIAKEEKSQPIKLYNNNFLREI